VGATDVRAAQQDQRLSFKRPGYLQVCYVVYPAGSQRKVSLPSGSAGLADSNAVGKHHTYCV
jgi:hypothetical protein